MLAGPTCPGYVDSHGSRDSTSTPAWYQASSVCMAKLWRRSWYGVKPNFTVENEAAIAQPPAVDFTK